MKNWKKASDNSLTTALILIAQDYALFDDALLANTKFKKNIDNPDFWISVSQSLRTAVAEMLSHNDDGEYDVYEESINDKVVFNYIMTPTNRFELNDIIGDTIEEYLTHCSGKRI